MLNALNGLLEQQKKTTSLLEELVKEQKETKNKPKEEIHGKSFGAPQQSLFSQPQPMQTSSLGQQQFGTAPTVTSAPPGLFAGGGTSSSSSNDALKTLDGKLMPVIPKAEPINWKNRVQEVLGFRRYCESVTSWLALLDPKYQPEIREALTLLHPILDTSLNAEQLQRSQRLFHVIKQSATTHATRFDILIRLYEAESESNNSGYELLRRLKIELCVRSRSECMTFRNAVLEFSFLKEVDLVDNIRRLEAEVVRYRQILGTFSGNHTTIQDLDLQDADLYQLLLNCLSGECKLYVQLNAPETFDGAKRACYVFYEKTVLNAPSLQKTAHLSLNEMANGAGAGKGKSSFNNEGPRECFRCGKLGHIAKECRVKLPGGKGSRSSSVDSNRSRGKGKGSTKNSKGNGQSSTGDQKGKSSDGHGKGGKGFGGKKGKGKGKPKGKRMASLGSDENAGDGGWSDIGESVWPSSEGDPDSKGSESPSKQTERLCSFYFSSLQHVPQPFGRRRDAREPFFANVLLEDEPITVSELRPLPQSGASKPQKNVKFENQIHFAKNSNEFPSDFDDSEAYLWLLDSGASRSVISTKYVHRYKILYKRELEQPLTFSTASGEHVEVRTELMVEAFFWVWEESLKKHIKRNFELRCLLSPVQHNLLSLGQMARHGWRFVLDEFGPQAFWGTCHFLVEMWGGVPWVSSSLRSRKSEISGKTKPDQPIPMEVDEMMQERWGKFCPLVSEIPSEIWEELESLQTTSESESSTWDLMEALNEVDSIFISSKDPCCASLRFLEKSSCQNESTPISVDALETADGHLPEESEAMSDAQIPPLDAPGFEMPDLKSETRETGRDRLQIRQEKSLFKHRLEGHTSYDPQCDYCKAGVRHHRRREREVDICEVVADFGYLTLPNQTWKFLCVVEPVSNAVSYIHIGMNTEQVTNNLRRFLQYVGLLSDNVQLRVLVRVDDDNTLAKAFRPLQCIIEKSGPQQHEAIGLAERHIRVCKEHLAAVRLDLQSEGIDLKFSEESLPMIFSI